MKEIYFKQAVIRNINKQKIKINNSKEYTKEEKGLILKGMGMAIDRVNDAYLDKTYRSQVELPALD